MPKLNSHHIWGHVERVDIVGTNVHGERDRKVARLESDKCRDCKRSEHDADNIAAASRNRAQGYAALEGSDRQVAWAESIRSEVIGKARESLDNHRYADVPKEQFDIASRTIDWMAAITSSAWWIEHQGTATAVAIRTVSQ